jgi:hypothetical protein
VVSLGRVGSTGTESVTAALPAGGLTPTEAFDVVLTSVVEAGEFLASAQVTVRAPGEANGANDDGSAGFLVAPADAGGPPVSEPPRREWNGGMAGAAAGAVLVAFLSVIAGALGPKPKGRNRPRRETSVRAGRRSTAKPGAAGSSEATGASDALSGPRRPDQVKSAPKYGGRVSKGKGSR